MDILVMTFGIPFLIGIVLGFCCKSYLNKVIRKRQADRHIDSLFTYTQGE